MTRDAARALLVKLQALADPARGGTPGECAAAAAKAAQLMARYNLDAPPPPPKRKRRVWAAPAKGAPWEFDFNIQTGQGSPNVKVHEYHDRRNWKIEVQR